MQKCENKSIEVSKFEERKLTKVQKRGEKEDESREKRPAINPSRCWAGCRMSDRAPAPPSKDWP